MSNHPTFKLLFIRLLCVSAILIVSILLAKRFLPGYEGYVTISVSVLGLLFLALKDLVNKKTKKD